MLGRSAPRKGIEKVNSVSPCLRYSQMIREKSEFGSHISRAGEKTDLGDHKKAKETESIAIKVRGKGERTAR